MIPTTWTALLLLTVAVLPGAMFTFGFERQAGSFGVTLADRVLRFVAASAVIAVLYALPVYAVHRLVFAGRPFGGGQFVTAWSGGTAALLAPAALGSVLGGLYATRGTRTEWSWIRTRLPPDREERLLQLLLGRHPAPRAWDHYFARRPSTYLRVRCHDGSWIGGRFAADSCAGGLPHETDLLLEEAWPVDADGVFGDGPLGYALYVPAESISYAEFLEPPGEEERDE